MKINLVVLLLCVMASTAMAETRRYPIPERGAMVLVVPDGWRDEIRRDYYPKRPITIMFMPGAGKESVVHVSPVWPTTARATRPVPGEVHDGVRKSADALQSQAVEPELKIIDFKTGEAFGSYYSATARAPKPGDYKHVTQGTFVLADLVVNFSIFANDDGDGVVDKALEMVRSARREAR